LSGQALFAYPLRCAGRQIIVKYAGAEIFSEKVSRRDVVHPLHWKLLGGLHAIDGLDGDIASTGTKTTLLLAYLALRPGKTHSRETLIGLLWSDRGDSQARASLRQALWSLGHALKNITPCPLVIDGEMISLDPARFETDVTVFERLAKQGTPNSLQSAIVLYRGELLEGIRVRDSKFEDFLSSERARLHELAVDACSKLLDHQVKTGSADAAVETAKRLLEIDPLQEGAHRALMQQYANKGQLNLAIKQYETCREIFRRELSMEPGAETKKLLDRIRHSAEETSTIRDSAVGEQREDRPGRTSLQEKPSIAVLPFLNLSGDPEQEYFSDGITQDIIAALSRLRWFLVIAWNSTFVYKGKSVEIKRIGQELDVRYVLGGSVRKAENRVRVTVELVDTKSGIQHWAEKYDYELTDIFKLQDEITQSVAAAILPELVAAEGVRSQNRSSEDLSAWDLVMRALTHYGRMTTRESETAIELLRQAVQQYPDYGPAHSLLAFALLVSGHVGWIPESDDYQDSAKLANRALELDDQDPWAHLALGYLAFTQRQTGESVREYKRALDLNPNFAIAYGYLGWALVFDGQSEEAIRYFQQALRMSPHDPLKAFFYSGTGVAHYYAHRYDDAIEWTNKAILERPGFTAAHRIHCASLAQAGKTKQAAAAMAKLRELQPNVSVAWIEQHVPYTERAMPHFLDGMRKAGVE
jgi:TolB-like protein/Tfp pilus assembly protein PilF